MAAAEVGIKVSVQGAQQVGSELQGIEGRLDRLTGSVKTAAHYGAGLAAAFGLVVPAISNTVRASILAADAVTTLNNSLRLSTGSVQAAGAAYEELFAIAQRSRVSFTELGATFASMNRAGQEMGVSQQRMLTVTAAVGNAMTISGGSAASLQAALVQLGQGMSSGVLRGEELNSVMEQAPRLAKALADGLGVPIGKLREMGAAGQITSEQVISALEKTAPQLAREVEGATLTVGQAFTVLSNAAIKFTGNADDATSTTAGLADAMVSLSKAITGVGESASAMGALRTIGETVKVLWSDVAFVFERTGVEIGGIAAQIAAMLRGDFSGAAAIRQEMVADAKAARQALDAYQQKTLTRPSKGDAVDTRAEDERNARRVAQLKAEQKSSEDLIKARRTLYGIKDDYETRLKGLADLYDNGNGKMPLEEYRAAVAQLAGENYKVAKSAKERATASTESYAAERAAAKEWEKTLRQASKGIEEAEGKTLGLNKAQEALVHYLESPAYQQHTEEMRQMALAKMYAWDAAIKHAEAVAAEHKIVEEWAKSRAKEGADLDARNQALREEVATIGLSKKAVAELARAKLEEAAAEQKAYAAALQSAALHAGPYKDAYEQAAKDALDNAEKLREQATLEQTKGAKQAAEEAKAEWQKAADDINRSLTDALMRGFESGKGFARNLRDTLKNMFNTLVLRPIISAVMQPVSMMVNGAVQGGMNAMGMGGGNLMGMAGNASSLYSGASSFNTGWFTNFGATAPASLYSSGAQLYSQGFETVGNGMMDLGNSMAQYSDAINTAGTWLSYGKAIYDVTQGKYGSAVGTAVGSYFGPIGAAIGGAIGGLVDKWTGSRGANHSGGVYSTTTTDRNAALSGLGLSGDPLSDFTDRGNKAIDEQLGKAVDSMGGLYNSLAKYAGGTAKQIDIVAGFAVNGQHKDEDSYGYFKLLDKLTGETLASYSKRDGGLGSDPEKAWAQYIADMGGALVGELRKADIPKWMDGIFAGLGDKITLDGLNGAMQQIAKIDGAFTQLGWHIGYLADISGDTQTALLELSGGVDGLMKNTGAYYQNFYSAAEQRAATERQLQKAFDSLGLKMPDIDASDARKQFRDIAEAQDLTTESGRKTWAAMMGLSEAFASVTQDAAGAATGVASFASQMSNAFGMTGDTISQILRDSVKEAQSAQEARRMAAEGFEQSFYDNAFSGLTSGLGDMIMSGVVTPMMNSLLAGATASSTALATGGTVAAGSMAAGGAAGGGAVAAGGAAAGGAVASGGAAAASLMSSVMENARAYIGSFVQILSDPEFRQGIKDISGLVGDVAGTLYQSGGAFQGGGSAPTLNTGSGQAAAEADNLKDALKRLGETMGDEVKRLRGLMVDDSSQSQTVLLARFATTTAQARAGDLKAAELLPELSKAIEVSTKASALSAVELARMRGWLAGSLEETAALAGVKLPALATGTNYVPRDMLALIHEGEAIVPKAYNPAAHGAGADGGPPVQALHMSFERFAGAQLESSLNAQRILLRAVRVLERWESGGMPAQRAENWSPA